MRGLQYLQGPPLETFSPEAGPSRTRFSKVSVPGNVSRKPQYSKPLQVGTRNRIRSVPETGQGAHRSRRHSRSRRRWRGRRTGVRRTCLRLRISGFGFRVSGFGFRVSGLRFRVYGFGFRVEGLRVGTRAHIHRRPPSMGRGGGRMGRRAVWGPGWCAHRRCCPFLLQG